MDLLVLENLMLVGVGLLVCKIFCAAVSYQACKKVFKRSENPGGKQEIPVP